MKHHKWLWDSVFKYRAICEKCGAQIRRGLRTPKRLSKYSAVREGVDYYQYMLINKKRYPINPMPPCSR